MFAKTLTRQSASDYDLQTEIRQTKSMYNLQKSVETANIRLRDCTARGQLPPETRQSETNLNLQRWELICTSPWVKTAEPRKLIQSVWNYDLHNKCPTRQVGDRFESAEMRDNLHQTMRMICRTEIINSQCKNYDLHNKCQMRTSWRQIWICRIEIINPVSVELWSAWLTGSLRGGNLRMTE